MEKKIWTRPLAEVEQFMANEYVAACWKINCNVPRGYGYQDNNSNGKYDSNSDTLLTPNDRNGPRTVWGCGTWHIGVQGVPNDGPVANAMWHANSGGSDYPVYYWRDGRGELDIHFSKVEDAEWESSPNAS